VQYQSLLLVRFSDPPAHRSTSRPDGAGDSRGNAVADRPRHTPVRGQLSRIPDTALAMQPEPASALKRVLTCLAAGSSRTSFSLGATTVTARIQSNRPQIVDFQSWSECMILLDQLHRHFTMGRRILFSTSVAAPPASTGTSTCRGWSSQRSQLIGGRPCCRRARRWADPSIRPDYLGQQI